MFDLFGSTTKAKVDALETRLLSLEKYVFDKHIEEAGKKLIIESTINKMKKPVSGDVARKAKRSGLKGSRVKRSK